jgi:hypothetical protein
VSSYEPLKAEILLQLVTGETSERAEIPRGIGRPLLALKMKGAHIPRNADDRWELEQPKAETGSQSIQPTRLASLEAYLPLSLQIEAQTANTLISTL